MSQIATVVSVLSIVGWLVLITRNAQVRGIGTRRVISYAAIWTAIIIAVVLLIEFSA